MTLPKFPSENSQVYEVKQEFIHKGEDFTWMEYIDAANKPDAELCTKLKTLEKTRVDSNLALKQAWQKYHKHILELELETCLRRTDLLEKYVKTNYVNLNIAYDDDIDFTKYNNLQRQKRYENCKSKLSIKQNQELAVMESKLFSLEEKSLRIERQGQALIITAAAIADSSLSIMPKSSRHNVRKVMARISKGTSGLFGILRAVNKNTGSGKDNILSGTAAMQGAAAAVGTLSAIALVSQMISIIDLASSANRSIEDQINLKILAGSFCVKLARFPGLLIDLGPYGMKFAKEAGTAIKKIGMHGGINIAGAICVSLGAALLLWSAHDLYKNHTEKESLENKRDEILSDIISLNKDDIRFMNKQKLIKAILSGRGLSDFDLKDSIKEKVLNIEPSIRQKLYEAELKCMEKNKACSNASISLISQSFYLALTIVAVAFPPASVITVGVLAAVGLTSLIINCVKDYIDSNQLKEFKQDFKSIMLNGIDVDEHKIESLNNIEQSDAENVDSFKKDGSLFLS